MARKRKVHAGFARRLWACMFPDKPRKRLGKQDRAFRDADIRSEVNIHVTAKDLAQRYNLSASRVRQIIRAGRKTPEALSKSKLSSVLFTEIRKGEA